MGQDLEQNSKRGTTKHTGVRFREHKTRKNGIRYDRYYSIRYRVNGVYKEEGIGWESKGFTEKRAYDILCEIKQNIRLGEGAVTLKEKRLEEEQKRIAQQEKNKLQKYQNMTFGEIWNEIYYPDCLLHKKNKLQQDELSMYSNHIQNFLENKKMVDITPLDIEKLKNKMEGKSASTINHALALVRQVFNTVKKANIFQGDNPVSKVKKLKVNNCRMRFLSREEANLLLNIIRIKSSQLYEISLLSLQTGLRAGEIFKLKWADIDLENKKIAVRDPKGGTNRYAYMTSSIFNLLKQKNVGNTPNDYVFKSRNGDKINEVSNAFVEAVKTSKLNEGITDNRQKVVFHTLRHTYASWLVQAGVSLYEVKELMGHSNISMTQRYSHLMPNNFRKAIDCIENGELENIV